jgi:hypothetical protein
MRRLLFGGLALALCACGPHLNSELRVERSYLPSADCAQGPFTLKVPVLGTKWGEEIELEARGRPIEGWARAVAPGTSTDEHHFKQWQTYAVVDNSRCKLAVSNATIAAQQWPTPDFKSVAPIAAAAAPVKEAPVELVATEHPPEVMVSGAGYYAQVTPMMNMSHRVDQVGEVPLAAGGYWTITFWNTAQLDLSHVVFVLRQRALVPSVPETEWVAHLEKEKADEKADEAKRLREAQERQRENDEKLDVARKHAQECRAHLDTSDCEDVKRDLEANAKYAEEQRAESEHERFCQTHVDDGTCAEFRQQLAYRNLQERLKVCRPHPKDPACADVREELRRGPPNGPPPVARAEEQPPKPSQNADWVPGSWVWDGWEYQWTGGGWRVPDSDIRAKLTAQAPAPPPEPKVEAAPFERPVLGAVWVPGAWHWSGAGWIWIAGGWRMPPSPGLRWRQPVWVVSSRGVQLDPGRWVR